MSTFVLVPEAHTGGWIWHEVVSLLRESGHTAHPVTLTGMGDPLRPARPDTGLGTHIADVVRAVEELQAPQVVLVGHGYGIHPVLGAADRLPERVARIVYLDAGLPRDGDPPAVLVPDERVRDQLAAGVPGTPAPSGGAHLVDPPDAASWHRWGSTDGVSAEGLDRLAFLAAPQPAATLTEPLVRSGAAGDLPTTGVLCTANGSSIALVEQAVALGDPRLQALTASGVTFFELATGHWPMLSTPGELARVLEEAARGEGHRIVRTPREKAPHLRPFLLDVPACPRERTGALDLYLPAADGPVPAVVLVHGGPVPEGTRPTPRDWPAYTGYGRHLAGRGVVAAMFDHRLHDVRDYPRAADDVAAAVAAVRADPRVDADRVALWFFSGGGLLSADWLAAPPPWLRCLAATYPILEALPGWGSTGRAFRPAEALRAAGDLPVVLTRVGREHPGIAATVAAFTEAADACGAALEIVDVPHAQHGFETIDHTQEARDAVRTAAGAVLRRLLG
ncbi:alpha/beta hydrolase [Streptomyces genisteinicus]|uniref:Alpha/beta hydrolase n=1 Tax=Streptomyces genisteinicus TaxID=2768068 RepID=A0A7H0HLV7_9ACTN|nr:alpha/beta hydrolase [Streptomyces genisteinicus]QNP61523.1 alpha/beta hydrolase [Streptomyces genisteinicus]